MPKNWFIIITPQKTNNNYNNKLVTRAAWFDDPKKVFGRPVLLDSKWIKQQYL